MRTPLPVLLVATLTSACGGATAGDSGSNPCGVVPDAAIYECEGGPPGSVGCQAPGLDPNAANNSNVYPVGCSVELPVQSTYCGAVGCTCMQNPTMPDAGFEFICAL